MQILGPVDVNACGVRPQNVGSKPALSQVTQAQLGLI